MMGRVHRLATVAWSVVAAGAGLGFVARDLLGLPGLAVALAWVAGAIAGGLAAAWARDFPAPRPPRRPPV
jgi:hypothetical protein